MAQRLRVIQLLWIGTHDFGMDKYSYLYTTVHHAIIHVQKTVLYNIEKSNCLKIRIDINTLHYSNYKN